MGACYVIGLLFFLLLASGEEQPWAKDGYTRDEVEPILYNIQQADDMSDSNVQDGVDAVGGTGTVSGAGIKSAADSVIGADTVEGVDNSAYK